MICAIVLAAGKSRRMGTQKLLLPVVGKPLAAHVAAEILKSAVEHVFVVVSPESDGVRAALAGLPMTLVTNTTPDGDMLSSIRSGLNSLRADCSLILIVPGDIPGITAELIAQLIATQQQSGKPIAVPVCQGRRGHPVLLSTKLRDELLYYHDGTGLRGLLHEHAADIAEVPVTDPLTLQDIDLPEDYARLVSPPAP
jgi:molybdenum cofactor cytidylyltransferase